MDFAFFVTGGVDVGKIVSCGVDISLLGSHAGGSRVESAHHGRSTPLGLKVIICIGQLTLEIEIAFSSMLSRFMIAFCTIS